MPLVPKAKAPRHAGSWRGWPTATSATGSASASSSSRASSDGDLTFEEYATVLTEHGFGHVPRYRAEQAFDATVQLAYGDLSALQDLACV
jgi:hypothetical protein